MDGHRNGFNPGYVTILLKMKILISVQSPQHPNAGRNLQQKELYLQSSLIYI